jgi:hypothetical protein
MHVVGGAVYSVVSVPVSALHGWDDDGDGLLGAPELARHHDALAAEVDSRFRVYDGAVEGHTVRVDLVLSPSHEGPQAKADHVVALKHTLFSGPVSALRAECDLFGDKPDEQELTLTAKQEIATRTEAEVATLTPGTTMHRFFRRPLLPPKALLVGVVALLLALACARQRPPALRVA